MVVVMFFGESFGNLKSCSLNVFFCSTEKMKNIFSNLHESMKYLTYKMIAWDWDLHNHVLFSCRNGLFHLRLVTFILFGEREEKLSTVRQKIGCLLSVVKYKSL